MSVPSDSSAWIERDDATTVVVEASCSLGRAPTNQIVLADDKVSRKHALIHRQGDDEYWLVDLGSSNGTYLDARRVSQPTSLRDGSVIRIGSSSLVFRHRPLVPPQSPDAPWSMQTIQDIRVAGCWLLLADIEGSTELARAVPVDELPVVTGRWFSECKQLIEAHGGSINKYLGDGFFAYWLDAVVSAEQLAGALRELKRLQSSGAPRFRVVLHHGFVSMGGSASMGEDSLAGPEVNFVFRMEKLAGGLGRSILMSEGAVARLGSFAAAADVGRHPLPGFEGEFGFFTS